MRFLKKPDKCYISKMFVVHSHTHRTILSTFNLFVPDRAYSSKSCFFPFFRNIIGFSQRSGFHNMSESRSTLNLSILNHFRTIFGLNFEIFDLEIEKSLQNSSFFMHGVFENSSFLAIFHVKICKVFNIDL